MTPAPDERPTQELFPRHAGETEPRAGHVVDVRPALAALLGVSALLILLLALWQGPGAETGFVVLASAFPVLLMALGAARGGGLGPTAWLLGLLLLWLEAAAVGMLVMRGTVLEGPWLAGLPLAAALQLYGLFLGPLVLVSIGFALTFGAFGVSKEELRELRRLARED